MRFPPGTRGPAHRGHRVGPQCQGWERKGGHLAAVTIGSIDPAVVNGQDAYLAGCKCQHFIVVTAGNADDTWAWPGPPIVRLAWQGTTTSDTLTPTKSGNTITFNASSASVMSGRLTVWSRGAR
jgi:hypothetical protein